MILSNKGIRALAQAEGTVEKNGKHVPYDDHNGKPITKWTKGATIGYGYLITTPEEFEKYEDGITEAEALDLFRITVARFEKIVNNRLKYRSLNVSQNKFDALVLQAYNTPKGNLNVIKALEVNELNRQVWLDNFSTQGGKFVQGLENRRILEWEIFSNNKYPEGIS